MNLATLLHSTIQIVAQALLNTAAREIADRAKEFPQWLPQPPTPAPPPDATQRATMHASLAAGRLWDRYRNPASDPCLSEHGRHMAVLYAAVLDDEVIRWLVVQIRHEHEDGPDHPPVSHEVRQ
jgi:hypothetical protein